MFLSSLHHYCSSDFLGAKCKIPHKSGPLLHQGHSGGCAERPLLHQGHLEGCVELPLVALGPLGRLCRAAPCCTRATWKAVQGGPLLHQDHLEGCAGRPFVALGPLGGLCRAAFFCTRATWKAANTAVDATKLLIVKTSFFEEKNPLYLAIGRWNYY